LEKITVYYSEITDIIVTYFTFVFGDCKVIHWGFMSTSWKITYIVLCLLGATLIILKNGERAWTDNRVALNFRNNAASTSTLISLKIDFLNSKGVSAQTKSNCEYEPPNYGGPDSVYGSGTR
jgi:hypothetical protein